MAEQAIHPDRVEAVGSKFDRDLVPGPAFSRQRAFRHEKRQVEFRLAEVEGDRLQASARQLRRRRHLLVDEHGLEDRMPAVLARRRQLFDQHVEGHRGVRQGIPHPAVEVADRGLDGSLLVDRRADHHRVQEVADHLGGGRVRAPRRRGGERDVPALGVAGEQQPEGKGEDDERRGADGSGEAPDALPCSRIEGSAQQRTPRGASLTIARPLEGQPQLVGWRLQPLPPPGELRRPSVILPCKPVNPVVVLGRRLRGLGHAPAVALGQLPPQAAEGPLVGQDVVQDHDQ